ncbi:MAG TPA: helix-turn-helix domain-containing protein [Ktedonobacteraceae bacterium]
MDASALPGQITVQEAADIIGCSKSRIYQYVKSGRLSARKMGPMLVLSLEEVKSFRRGPAGRQRGIAPPWRRYRNQSRLLATVVQVQIRPGKQEQLQRRLDTLFEEHTHTFTANVARTIMADEKGVLEIILTWKNTEMPNETTQQQDLRSFQQAFADVLDWDTATYTLKKILLHT